MSLIGEKVLIGMITTAVVIVTMLIVKLTKLLDLILINFVLFIAIWQAVFLLSNLYLEVKQKILNV